MAIFFSAGEQKKRPGLFQRHENISTPSATAAKNGICAIPIQATWGPLGKVLANTTTTDLKNNYGSGTYGAGYTVPAAIAMFNGGAATVYTYRLGTGGTQASKELDGLTVTAKYPGTMAISVAVQAKLGDATKKQFLVYVGTTLMETWEFAADETAEGKNLIAATANSKYVTITGEAATVSALAVASGALTGGTNPTVTNEDYSKAFAAMETTYYNVIALDVDDDESMTLSRLLKEYMNGAFNMGKLGHYVVGQKTTIPFETRLTNCASFNDAQGVFLGGGYKSGTESKDGVMAICHTAGIIAATPSNHGITHAVIDDATDLCEDLTYAQYEAAINCGMLMLSKSSEGSIWFDSAITTLTNPEPGTQDEGWKKIRRGKCRFEMIDRLDRALNPKVGRVSADSDGIADIIQTAQRVLNAMVTERKLRPGASFKEDTANPAKGDSAWFVIQADDYDSLEMIYLVYQFRYSQDS